MAYLNDVILTLNQKKQLEQIILNPNILHDLNVYINSQNYAQTLEMINYQKEYQIRPDKNHYIT